MGVRELSLTNNSITDISALSGHTSLRYVDLNNNPDFNDIQPLLDNTGLGPGDQVFLTNTNVGCTDVAALQAKGLMVESDCR
jgi:Leucine-rich repeat (LRR) protein